MKVGFHRTDDEQTVKALHSICFPGDEWETPTSKHVMWIGEDETGTPVAFCTAKKLRSEEGIFLERAGVLPLAAGLGLQRRMIRIRERWARSIEAAYILTYTTFTNYPSITNLLRCGFRFYTPARAWAGREVHYFEKQL